ncbi:transposase [Streptomyces griseorubiginosus]|uniref:IS110 family transposase n=1 Tax=Streptomyces griseorubiginosus TaxID=67304 RepID=UPI000782E7B0|nr:transposase [Streptomyces griseorubiginosus]
MECTGSYAAGLARYLATQQVAVVEVNQPDRSTRRRRGKTDAVDAEAAARAALSGIAQALPKSDDGQVEAPRMLRLAKNSAVY